MKELKFPLPTERNLIFATDTLTRVDENVRKQFLRNTTFTGRYGSV